MRETDFMEYSFVQYVVVAYVYKNCTAYFRWLLISVCRLTLHYKEEVEMQHSSLAAFRCAPCPLLPAHNHQESYYIQRAIQRVTAPKTYHSFVISTKNMSSVAVEVSLIVRPVSTYSFLPWGDLFYKSVVLWTIKQHNFTHFQKISYIYM